MSEWITTSWSSLGWVVVTAIGIYAATVIYTRLAGLRSFAKMSSFDFAMTVAVGSMIATTVLSKSVSLAQGAVGLAAVYALQIGVARLRTDSHLRGSFDNAPLLLMVGEEILYDNLARGRVTEDDLRSKLREANVLHPRQIRAVVMEATGDVAVMHSQSEDEPFDPDLLRNVRGVEPYRERLERAVGGPVENADRSG